MMLGRFVPRLIAAYWGLVALFVVIGFLGRCS
jgi:hypothetical protein